MKKVSLLMALFYVISFAQTGARYLIITHDDFYNAIQPLAQWKHKKGMKTEIKKLSEIGSTSTQIRDYIVNAYNTWDIPPEYLLLVGANNYLPFVSSSGTVSDNFYANMDGDIYNEILPGRLTVHSATEAQTVVNKMLLYERTPNMTDSLWFIRAVGIVRMDYDPYDDSIYWSDVHQMKSYMLNADYDLVDTLSNLYGDDKYDVIDKVNLGRSFVLYRGQGVGNWWSPFDVNPDNTANGEKLPIVLSLTCSTIGTGSSPATAERWFLTGTPTQPHGASGYFATTTVISGGAYLRSAVSKGFFDAIFRYGKRTFGQACEGGRTRVYNLYSSGSEYRGFNTIGDPEMNIWTAIPKDLDVTHASSIPTGNQNYTVTVMDNSTPVNRAVVCLLKGTEVYAVDSTGTSGVVTLTINPQYVGTMDVTVTAYNYYPYEGTCQVTGSVPNVSVTVTPSSTTVPQGGVLGYTPYMINNGGTAVTFQYWTDLILYNGQPYGGNPIFGPVQLTLQPGQSRSRLLNFNVPNHAPLGTYTLYARIGWNPNDIWDEDYFEFTITASELPKIKKDDAFKSLEVDF